MAGKIKTVFVCQECGYESPKWMGQCPSCNEWNTLEEQVISDKKSAIVGMNYSATKNVISSAKTLSDINTTDEERFITQIGELDRVLGGGIVKGSVVLLSGDPGIGKSTILLQICQSMRSNINVLYVSGEESAVQIKLRAKRLGVDGDNVSIMTETDTQAICEYIMAQKPNLVMIDSIQTLQISELSSSAGSVVQVRESTNMLLRVGKSLGIPIFIVGHVNKGGDIAGPKVLEHIVDKGGCCCLSVTAGNANLFCRIISSCKLNLGNYTNTFLFECYNKRSFIRNAGAFYHLSGIEDFLWGMSTLFILNLPFGKHIFGFLFEHSHVAKEHFKTFNLCQNS